MRDIDPFYIIERLKNNKENIKNFLKSLSLKGYEPIQRGSDASESWVKTPLNNVYSYQQLLDFFNKNSFVFAVDGHKDKLDALEFLIVSRYSNHLSL